MTPLQKQDAASERLLYIVNAWDYAVGTRNREAMAETYRDYRAALLAFERARTYRCSTR